jgi:hypothetical protein
MTLPNPDAAVAAATTVSGATKVVPISGKIGYCFEYPGVSAIHCFFTVTDTATDTAAKCLKSVCPD